MGGLFYDESLYWAERAFAIHSGSSDSYFHVGTPLLSLMSERQTEEFLTRATERFPDALRIHILWTWLDAVRGRDESAVQRARQLLERFPPNDFQASFTAAEILYLVRAEDAASVLERLYRAAPDVRLFLTGRTLRTTYSHTLLTAGLGERAESLFDESVTFNRQALAEGDESYAIPYELAAIAAVRGSTDEALDWLERAYEAGLRHTVAVERDPMLDALREEPRLVELVARMHRDVAGMRARALSPDGPSMFRDSLSAR